jgi:hypothetical protein
MRLRNLHFLLAGQQRDLAHLLEIHADGVVQDVQPAFFLLVLGFGLADAVHLGLVHDGDFEVGLMACQYSACEQPGGSGSGKFSTAAEGALADIKEPGETQLPVAEAPCLALAFEAV